MTEPPLPPLRSDGCVGTRALEARSGSREWLALLLWLGVAGLQVATSFALAGGDSSEGDEPIFSYSLGVGSIFVYAVILLVTWGIARLSADPRTTLGLRPFSARYLGYGAILVVASLIVAAVLEPILKAGEEQGLAPQTWESGKLAPFLFNALVIVTIVPFTEELFYRGLGVSVLARFGPVVAILGTAIVFGLAHGLLVALPPLVFFAVGLAWIRLRSESVWPGVAAHAAYNAIGLAAAAIAAS